MVCVVDVVKFYLKKWQSLLKERDYNKIVYVA